ncbi:MAG TPA: ABC transporter ATP-binding protein, partial [Candidatus Limnocylindrales bacterium]
VAIVGQNGAGKTTLIKHLNGLLRPSAGRVLVGGSDIAGVPVSTLAGRIGFVFQRPEDQLFQRSVEREVAFGPRNLGSAEPNLGMVVEQALALVGLASERATNPFDLGPSLRKLVALASVLAMEPAVLVLDEPTSGQDAPGAARIGAIIDAWAAAGRTVVATTHDMELCARHFDRVVVLRSGRVLLEGPPAAVFAPANSEVLATTGLRPPPAARVAARLGLAGVPADAAELLAMLARASSDTAPS